VFSLPKSSDILSGLGILTSLYRIKFFNQRIPLFCEWELTNFCNMECPFCSTLTNDRNSKPDISPQTALNMIDQLGEMGTKMIHFSGGEPTLRRDLPDLVAKAKQYNMMVSFTTNGSASIERMEKLLEADIIRVSIDGTRAFHDKGRMHPGAFKKAVETIRFLVSEGKKPIITTVYKDDTTYIMLEELAQLAQELKCKISLNVLTNSFEENVQGNETHLYHRYLETIKKLQNQFSGVLVNHEPFLSIIKLGGLDIFGCRAMDVAISIKPDGKVCIPCTRFSKFEMEGNLKNIFYSDEAEELRRVQGKDSLCKGCAMRCMSSASGLLTVNGQISTLDTYGRSI
jgi:MoaA/NifB/PqqE/SkfB family radical SAM enzyme